MGGVVWGIGQAMTEETVLDKRYGNYVTRALADYHVPVNLDVGEIEVYFLPEEDKIINRLGVKGIGELGITKKQIRMKMNIEFLRDEPFNSEQWITNVYKNENEIWICVMTQEAPVTCK